MALRFRVSLGPYFTMRASLIAASDSTRTSRAFRMDWKAWPTAPQGKIAAASLENSMARSAPPRAAAEKALRTGMMAASCCACAQNISASAACLDCMAQRCSASVKSLSPSRKATAACAAAEAEITTEASSSSCCSALLKSMRFVSAKLMSMPSTMNGTGSRQKITVAMTMFLSSSGVGSLALFGNLVASQSLCAEAWMLSSSTKAARVDT
mmetsp:Transcript_22238/g.52955  ORF Transcript_22238/g.52955 Transcript_22238/m.52955 type:complete len:211 (-) Transcript_22238:793-1425(-)